MANKNDDKILELKKQINKKKEELASIPKFNPITNCILTEYDNYNYNINALDLKQLELLLIKLNMFGMSAEDLGYTSFELNGYELRDWIADIKSRIKVLSVVEEKRKLKAMEAKLDKLLSEDKKTELELDAITEMLKG